MVPLAWLDSCTPSSPNATVVLALFRVVAPVNAVPATTTVLSSAVVAGSIVAAIAAPASAAGSMQRAVTELHIALCDGLLGEPLLLAESILQLRIGTDDLSYRRGAVVGNVAFWAVVAALAIVVVLQRARGVLRCGDTPPVPRFVAEILAAFTRAWGGVSVVSFMWRNFVFLVLSIMLIATPNTRRI